MDNRFTNQLSSQPPVLNMDHDERKLNRTWTTQTVLLILHQNRFNFNKNSICEH